MLTWFLQSMLCLSAFYALYYFVLQRETLFQLNRFYLLFSLIAGLILPLLHFAVDVSPDESVYVLAPAMVVAGYEQAISTSLYLAGSDGVAYWSVLLTGIYIAGVVFMFMRLAMAWYQLITIRRSGRIEFIQGNKVILSSRITSPFSFMRDIYLPESHRYTAVELEEVIIHESAHIRYLHTLDILVIEGLCAFFWPCLPVWLYRKSIKDVHEYEADTAVLKVASWEEYASFLIGQQQNHLYHQFTHPLIYSQLKKRLVMMNKSASGNTALVKYLAIVPILFISFILFACRPADGIADENRDTLSLDSNPGASGSEETMPRFPFDQPNQMDSLYTYLGRNLNYPEMDMENGIEGKVIIQFVVGADGKILDENILKSPSESMSKEVLRIFEKMKTDVGPWIPGTKDGKEVATTLTLPISFAFDGEDADKLD